jgi:hypothetical protein
VRDPRAAVRWLATPLGLFLAWLSAEWLMDRAPGTALVLGLVGLLAIVVCAGVLFYVSRQ